MITDFSPRHLEIDGVSTPSGSEFEPDDGVESEQNEESLDDRHPDSSEAIYTKRGPKAMKATQDVITQACGSCAPIPTAVSSGGKHACGSTLDSGPVSCTKQVWYSEHGR